MKNNLLSLEVGLGAVDNIQNQPPLGSELQSLFF
jgi:hypothetical protein